MPGLRPWLGAACSARSWLRCRAVPAIKNNKYPLSFFLRSWSVLCSFPNADRSPPKKALRLEGIPKEQLSV